jgi:hypothetical protein
VNREKGRDAGVDPAQLHHYEPEPDCAYRPAPVLLHVVVANDIQRRDLGDQFVGKFAPLPITIDDRQHFRLAEFAHRRQDLLLLRGQLLLHQKVVRAAPVSNIVGKLESNGIGHLFPSWLIAWAAAAGSPLLHG